LFYTSFVYYFVSNLRVKMLEKLIAIPLPEIIIFSAITILTIRFLYDLTILIAILKKEKNEKLHKEIPISLIICAKNEAENLKNYLPIICEQNYTNYEIIVVNDASTDDTARILRAFDNKYTNFRYTHIPKDPKFEHGKKLALTIGIKAAKHDQILLTDADCIPASKEWVNEMAKRLQKKEIVLGYGAYKKEKGFLNRLIRFDTLQIARTYFGLARLGLPYMGVGRNLAWKRSIYEGANGFSSHYHLKSGDDDILVNQMARRKNTTVCLNPNAFTISVPEKKFNNWFLQKRRHLTAGSQYRFIHKIALAFDGLLKLLTWPVFAIAIVYAKILNPFVYIFIGTFMVWQLFAWKMTMKKLKEKGFLLLIPFFEVYFSILPFIILFKNFVQRKQSQWK
jgi:cellulose synthase/poly-beta-1,6-N-acetylglucosamine synthase-like glycosyltransferase